jgi:2-oxoglutarate ferredoxin oxidoreductase subunit delta
MALGSVAPRTTRAPAEWAPLVIADGHCKGCELCVAACPKAVLALDRTRVNALGYHSVRLIDPAACTSCAICARVCPDAVFTIWARPRPERDP